jgi:hypothetical protein
MDDCLQKFPSKEHDRDIRVDFFRGAALILIFIDHIPGNMFARFTLTNFGFADAAEIFVLLAGIGAFLAYAKAFAEGSGTGLVKVGLRIRDLYAAHLLVLVVCVAGLAIVARAFQNPVYFEHVNLIPFNDDPAGAIWRALLLVYQPGYLNILPLYIALLAWAPLLFWLMQRHVAWALIASGGLWVVGSFLQWNFASYPMPRGWEFNPLTWQFLFTLGAVAGSHLHRYEFPRRSRLLFLSAVGYISFSFIVAAPWSNLPGLSEAILLPDFRTTVSKQDLSLWRLGHIVALAYVTALLVPRRASWLSSPWARWLVNCGQHSLPIFCLSIILSLMGFVIFVEAGHGLLLQILVNVSGVTLLGLTAWKLAQLKRARATAARDGVKTPGWWPSRL